MHTQPENVILIGSGIAGLATAIRLQHAGYQVTVFESNEYPGGKLTAFTQDGFRFDAGPSLFTMPHLVDDIFRYCGKQPGDYFRYIRKDESCRYFWEDGTTLTASADNKQFAKSVQDTFQVPAAAILAKLEKSKKQYQLVGQIFLEKPLNRLSTWLNRDVLKALLQLKVFNLFSTMHQRNVTELQHPKLVQLFDRYATYNGSSPYKAPALLNMIPHLEHGYGTFLPEGGMTDITNSLVSLAIDEGVQFRFNESVLEILYQQQKVSGVRTANGVYPANRIVSNMDITPTYRKLLPHLPAPEKTLMQERSSAALIFYWGINRQYKMLGLHNILFSEDYQGEFENLFHQKQAFFDPTVYINITSKDIPSDAPEGNENWFVMVNAPENNGQDWDTLVSTFRSAIIKKINKTLNTSIEEFIVTERVLDPRGIEQQTSSMGGSLYGTSSNNRYAAFLRHANQHQHLKGLYFCGGSVHPGGGIPLCLLSGKIVSELILNPS